MRTCDHSELSLTDSHVGPRQRACHGQRGSLDPARSTRRRGPGRFDQCATGRHTTGAPSADSDRTDADLPSDTSTVHTTLVRADTDCTDIQLVREVRNGRRAAYGVLWTRHVNSAYRLARQLAHDPADRDDLVSIAFAKVLDGIIDKDIMPTAFRAYLLTALRHTAYDKIRTEKKAEIVDDVTTVSGVRLDAVSVAFQDTVQIDYERSLAARAFATLPERWWVVLSYTEIAGMKPEVIAPLMQLTPNGVSALAYRAREALKQAYLQAHLTKAIDTQCTFAAARLVARVRGRLSKRDHATVDTHLEQCHACRDLLEHLADVNSHFRP